MLISLGVGESACLWISVISSFFWLLCLLPLFFTCKCSWFFLPVIFDLWSLLTRSNHEKFCRHCSGRFVPDRVRAFTNRHNKHPLRQPRKLHQYQPRPGSVFRRSLHRRQQPRTQPQQNPHPSPSRILPRCPSHGHGDAPSSHRCQETLLLKCWCSQVSFLSIKNERLLCRVILTT